MELTWLNPVCRLSPESDLTKVLVKAVRELAEPEGSTVRAVEKFVHTVYEIEVEQVPSTVYITILYFI
jgi:hypothetical protein